MSRLWNKPRLCAYLGEDQLALCQVLGRRRPRVLQKGLQAVEGRDAPAVAAALDAWLQAHPLVGQMQGAELQVVLGTPWVKYLLLPWHPSLVATDFRLSMARALYARQFALEATAQDLRFGALRFGQPLLAAFVASDLLPSLTATAARHGARLTVMEPLLARVIQRFATALPKGEGTLLIAEASRVIRVGLSARCVQSLQLRPLATGNTDVFTGDEAGRARRFAPLQPTPVSETSASLRLGPGEGFSPDCDGAFAFALCGVF